MKYAALTLCAIFSNLAFAGESVDPTEAIPSKVYYRCESRGLDFESSSLMKEVKPGQFVINIPVNPAGLTDNCVISVVEDEGSGAELCFMDLFPSLDKDEAAVTGKSYSLGANQRLGTFKVNYQNAGSRRVTFDAKSRSFRVEKSASTVIATNK